MIGKIQYTCKACGWAAAVPELWADLKPTYCGNRRCEYSKAMAPRTKKSFALDPSNLEIRMPEVAVESSSEQEEVQAPTPLKKKKARDE
jgi:hypothetical protein